MEESAKFVTFLRLPIQNLTSIQLFSLLNRWLRIRSFGRRAYWTAINIIKRIFSLYSETNAVKFPIKHLFDEMG